MYEQQPYLPATFLPLRVMKVWIYFSRILKSSKQRKPLFLNVLSKYYHIKHNYLMLYGFISSDKYKSRWKSFSQLFLKRIFPKSQKNLKKLYDPVTFDKFRTSSSMCTRNCTKRRSYNALFLLANYFALGLPW